MTPTYLQHLDQLSPRLCWALARKPGRRAVTQQELCQRTGWSSAKVQRFCKLTTWANETVLDTDTFRQACGVPRDSERRHRAYLKRTLDLAVTVNGLAHFTHHGPEAIRALRKMR
jgi:hypothetical protein